ncbi:nucleoside hydrolase [Pseudonocardia sp. WMMC193]|uniref:nucleoside hydrolase n=1 Tax=Pseudonocardia sp. WMMC193 TaxID=2911965 RepID=UPI001F15CE66|nr:nucleoside hydrolase [Pseudonocardia sp. WMMC193]MCF7549923.1 nucleoside hydrolase [Pseudonocardia sp. WMMC193]
MATPVYLDCDTGIDDSLALLYLLHSPEVRLLGIGAVHGNIDAETAARNTLDLLALAGAEVPVAIGARDPRAGVYAGGAPHVHGVDGIGGVALPPSGRAAVAESAAEMLVRLAAEHPGELEVLAVGPLTNLAAALDLDPDLPAKVRRVVVMGGAAQTSGNVSAVSEANIHNDPEAAALVVAAPWPIVLVPLDVTMAHRFTEADQAALAASADPAARAVGDMLDQYFTFYQGVYGVRGCALHDPLAAALLVGGITATHAPAVPVVVDDTHGPGRGQTLVDLRHQRSGETDVPGAHVRVVLDIDPPLAPHLRERLLARYGPSVG